MADFKTGDRVRLLKFDDWFFKGLPAEEVRFLKSCVGSITPIIGFDSYGYVELEFSVPGLPQGQCEGHTVWVDRSWIEKV